MISEWKNGNKHDTGAETTGELDPKGRGRRRMQHHDFFVFFGGGDFLASFFFSKFILNMVPSRSGFILQ